MKINIHQKSNRILFRDLPEGDLFLWNGENPEPERYQVYVKIPYISQKANGCFIFQYNVSAIGRSGLYYFGNNTKVIPIQTLTVSPDKKEK